MSNKRLLHHHWERSEAIHFMINYFYVKNISSCWTCFSISITKIPKQVRDDVTLSSSHSPPLLHSRKISTGIYTRKRNASFLTRRSFWCSGSYWVHLPRRLFFTDTKHLRIFQTLYNACKSSRSKTFFYRCSAKKNGIYKMYCKGYCCLS